MLTVGCVSQVTSFSIVGMMVAPGETETYFVEHQSCFDNMKLSTVFSSSCPIGFYKGIFTAINTVLYGQPPHTLEIHSCHTNNNPKTTQVSRIRRKCRWSEDEAVIRSQLFDYVWSFPKFSFPSTTPLPRNTSKYTVQEWKLCEICCTDSETGKYISLLLSFICHLIDLDSIYFSYVNLIKMDLLYGNLFID